jgi:hypothetical protein
VALRRRLDVIEVLDLIVMLNVMNMVIVMFTTTNVVVNTFVCASTPTGV